MRVSRLFTGRGLRGGCNDAKGKEREGGGRYASRGALKEGQTGREGCCERKGGV
jgi:hypothetical protein